MKPVGIVFSVVGCMFAFAVTFSIFCVFNLFFGLDYHKAYMPHTQKIQTESSSFPRIIHQTWKTKTLLDFQTANRSKLIIEFNERYNSFEYPLYIDADFEAIVTNYFPWFKTTWNKLTPFIKKVDTIKYMLMYLRGGVYMDLDLELLDVSKFDEYFENTYPEKTLIVTSCSSFIPFIKTGPVLMIAHPKHSFFLDMLHYITTHVDEHVLYSTGPYAMNTCLKRYLRKQTRRHTVMFISSAKAGLPPLNSLVHRMTQHHNAGTWKGALGLAVAPTVDDNGDPVDLGNENVCCS